MTEPSPAPEPVSTEEELALLESENLRLRNEVLELQERVSQTEGQGSSLGLESVQKARDLAMGENARLLARIQEMQVELEILRGLRVQDQETVSRLIVERNARSRAHDQMRAVHEDVSVTLTPLTEPEQVTPMTEGQIVAVAKQAKDKLDGKVTVEPV